MYPILKSQKPTPPVTSPVRTNQSRNKGMTLIEVMISITVLMIGLMGVSSAYVSGRRQIIKQQQYQSAVHLASQKIEEIKATGYLGMATGEQQEELSFYGLSCQRQTVIELTAESTPTLPKPCKKITVTTQWNDLSGSQHEVKLATYVGP